MGKKEDRIKKADKCQWKTQESGCQFLLSGARREMPKVLRECRERGMTVTGPILCTLAQEEGKDLGLVDLRASEVWPEKFKARNKIQALSISGDSKSVNVEVVKDCIKEFPVLIEAYDIFNCYEAELFYKIISRRSLILPEDDHHGAKRSKDRITLLLACTMGGQKSKPLTVCKSANPRALKGANRENMPVRYFHTRTLKWMGRCLSIGLKGSILMSVVGSPLEMCCSSWTTPRFTEQPQKNTMAHTAARCWDY